MFYSREKPNERRFSFSSNFSRIRDAKGKWCILPDIQCLREIFDTVDVTNRGTIDKQGLAHGLADFSDKLFQGQLRLLQQIFSDPTREEISLIEFVGIYHYVQKAKTIFEDIKSAGQTIIGPALVEPLVGKSETESQSLSDEICAAGVEELRFEQFLLFCLQHMLRSMPEKSNNSEQPIVEAKQQ